MSDRLTPTPIPDAVAVFKATQFPARTAEAVKAQADAERTFRLCRTPYTRVAREYAIADLHTAAKVLATVPSRHPLVGGEPR